jgi:hypothetical protein
VVWTATWAAALAAFCSAVAGAAPVFDWAGRTTATSPVLTGALAAVDRTGPCDAATGVLPPVSPDWADPPVADVSPSATGPCGVGAGGLRRTVTGMIWNQVGCSRGITGASSPNRTRMSASAWKARASHPRTWKETNAVSATWTRWKPKPGSTNTKVDGRERSSIASRDSARDRVRMGLSRAKVRGPGPSDGPVNIIHTASRKRRVPAPIAGRIRLPIVRRADKRDGFSGRAECTGQAEPSSAQPNTPGRAGAIGFWNPGPSGGG